VCPPNYAAEETQGLYSLDCNLERRDISMCVQDTECLNGGKCIGYECFCPQDTVGDWCEYV
jgi:hypothetical protein